MYFDLRNHSSSSDRFDGADRLATSVVSVDEWLAFGDEFRRKDEGTIAKSLPCRAIIASAISAI
jgi:hypothetical protein